MAWALGTNRPEFAYDVVRCAKNLALRRSLAWRNLDRRRPGVIEFVKWRCAAERRRSGVLGSVRNRPVFPGADPESSALGDPEETGVGPLDLALRPSPTSLTLSDGSVPRDTTILEYFDHGPSVIVFVVTADRIDVVDLNIPAAAVLESVRRYRHGQLRDRAASRDLYSRLVAPVEHLIRTDRLAVDGAGIVGPEFETFSVDDEESVVDRWVVSYLPAGSWIMGAEDSSSQFESVTILASDPAAGEGSSGIGRAVVDYSASLAWAPKQSRSRPLASTLFDARATAVDVLVFHGEAELDSDDVWNSGIVLSGSSELGTPTVLRGYQICSLPLARSRLVCLPDCGGSVADFGAARTLASAFSWAGASAVLATSWDVDSAESVRFHDRFFRLLAQVPDACAAASEVKRGLRRSGVSPLSWAAFSIWKRF